MSKQKKESFFLDKFFRPDDKLIFCDVGTFCTYNSTIA